MSGKLRQPFETLLGQLTIQQPCAGSSASVLDATSACAAKRPVGGHAERESNP
jgi:hypothetical protein